MTIVAYCGCNATTEGAKYQENTYGKGMRVMNSKREKPGEPIVYRCTCCEKEQQVQGAEKGR